MQSLIAFLAVLVGVAVANPMVLSPAEQNQQNKAISAKEFLKKMFPDSMMTSIRSDDQMDADIVERLRALGLREAANIAEQVDLRQVLRDSDLCKLPYTSLQYFTLEHTRVVHKRIP